MEKKSSVTFRSFGDISRGDCNISQFSEFLSSGASSSCFFPFRFFSMHPGVLARMYVCGEREVLFVYKS
jgi:hypothetical protein